MTQNIYDDPEFFAKYSQLERSVKGSAGAVEWPHLRALLPEQLNGVRIVDLGCGFGWFCRWARAQGASQVLGLDVSENMLAHARSMTSDPAITYLRADLEHLALPQSSFDCAYSSLAFHYIKNLPKLLETVHRSLLPSARFVFSVEHPIFTAPLNPEWLSDTYGQKRWPVDHYMMEESRSTDWLTKGVIKYHRTVASYINLLVGLGFSIVRLEEWGPTEDEVGSRPNWAEERERPIFLLIAANK
jgi:ubiquinone/menaquinone biosynthesis C-methylase UbiE